MLRGIAYYIDIRRVLAERDIKAFASIPTKWDKIAFRQVPKQFMQTVAFHSDPDQSDDDSIRVSPQIHDRNNVNFQANKFPIIPNSLLRIFFQLRNRLSSDFALRITEHRVPNPLWGTEKARLPASR